MMIQRFLRCEKGTTSIEYAFIAMLVCVAVVAGATMIGTQLTAHLLGFVPYLK